MSMPVHKFIHKHQRKDESPIVYNPHSNLKYPPTAVNGRWEIYAQESFVIQPRSSFIAILGFGVSIRRGLVFVSLKQSLKVKRCSLQDGVVSETVDDIIVTIQNNSDTAVTINAAEPLCCVGTQAI